ncbi:MAG: hypothetical protein F4Y79_03015 [Gemmatimonadetes bacterium]|nr:hypothetical protein [Gemmatimonadota bacterium]
MNQLDIPIELSDAWVRLQQAADEYVALQHAVNEFLYEYLKGMPMGKDPETGEFFISLRHPKDSIMSGKPKVLVGQMIENCRVALDYMVYELSLKNHKDLEYEHAPQFVISDTEARFNKEAKHKLQYLTDEQREFIRSIQPFKGNALLGIFRDATNKSKHRQLLTITDMTGFDIYFDSAKNKHKYKDAWLLKEEDGQVFFARPKDRAVLLMNEYKAIPILKAIAEHTGEIVLASRKFFK